MSRKRSTHQGSVSEPGRLIIGVRRAFTCCHWDAIELTTKMWIMILEAVLEAISFVATGLPVGVLSRYRFRDCRS